MTSSISSTLSAIFLSNLSSLINSIHTNRSTDLSIPLEPLQSFQFPSPFSETFRFRFLHFQFPVPLLVLGEMSSWASYLARGVPRTPQHPVIYHMCVKKDYEEQTQSGGLYFPPTYPQDGFIHATADASFLLSVGTHFYKSDLNEWICLEIDVQYLRSPVKYEPGDIYLMTPLISSICSCTGWINSSKTSRYK